MYSQSFLSLACLLQLIPTILALPADQQPFKLHPHDNAQTVRAELKKAEIIPTVIDDFLPSLSLSVSWKKKKSAGLGNLIKPKDVQSEPHISLSDETSSIKTNKSGLTYVITLTDPDAPSRDDPEWSEMCHWIAANVTLSESVFSILPLPEYGLTTDDDDDDNDDYNRHEDDVDEVNGASKHERQHGKAYLDAVMPYKPPGPPPKTGKHRYVFLVFAPSNGTSESLHLSKPKERQHWGTGKVRGGVREWAGENGLVPVAANFVYAKNKKQ